MSVWTRAAAAVVALAMTGISGWGLLVVWASSTGLYENTEHRAGPDEVWSMVAALVLALAAVVCSATRRVAVAAGLSLVAASICVAVGVSDPLVELL